MPRRELPVRNPRLEVSQPRRPGGGHGQAGPGRSRVARARFWIQRTGRRHLASAAGQPAPAHFSRHQGAGRCQQHGLQQPRRRSPGRDPRPMETSPALARPSRSASIWANPKSPRWPTPPGTTPTPSVCCVPTPIFLSSTSVPPTPPTSANSRTNPPSTKSSPPSRKFREARTAERQKAEVQTDQRVRRMRTIRNPQYHNPQLTRPILVKVAPDLSFAALDEILELAGPRQIAGIVATNTTLTRPETSDQKSRAAYAAAGGLSGRPLRARSTEVVRHLYRQTRGALPIIGVGGIFNAADAWEKITAGASPGANLHRHDLPGAGHRPRNRARLGPPHGRKRLHHLAASGGFSCHRIVAKCLGFG